MKKKERGILNYRLFSRNTLNYIRIIRKLWTSAGASDFSGYYPKVFDYCSSY